MANAFALNHRVAPRQDLERFFDLAIALNVSDVEIRNDLDAVPIANHAPAEGIRAAARDRGLTIISINALQRFNDWNADRHAQAAHLIDYARACGAKALVLCPVNDTAFTPSEADRREGLRIALRSLAPLLREAGIVGLIEPLGFAECSLRSKREAVEAIDAVEAADAFALVHDTFHHHVAGEAALFPDRTGLVHISGVDEAAVPASAMRDPHRVLVGRSDRIDNLGQMRALVAGGYQGPFSFEPFADSVAQMADIRVALADSMAHVAEGLKQPGT